MLYLFGNRRVLARISAIYARLTATEKRVRATVVNSIITFSRAPRVPLVPHPCPIEGHETVTSGQ